MGRIPEPARWWIRAGPVAAIGLAAMTGCGGLHTSARPPPAALPGMNAGLTAMLARASLAFVPNRGQSDHRVRFESRTAAATLFFTRHRAVLSFREPEHQGYALALRFLGSRAHVRLSGEAPGPARYSY